MEKWGRPTLRALAEHLGFEYDEAAAFLTERQSLAREQRRRQRICVVCCWCGRPALQELARRYAFDFAGAVAFLTEHEERLAKRAARAHAQQERERGEQLKQVRKQQEYECERRANEAESRAGLAETLGGNMTSALMSTHFTRAERMRFLDGEALWGCHFWQISRLFVKTQRCDLLRCTASAAQILLLCRMCNVDY